MRNHSAISNNYMGGGRIDFIDLAKGICILSVVMFHTNVDFFLSFTHLRMPLYFVLSGLFFKTYGGLGNFMIKKINKIIVPFFTFLLLGFSTLLVYLLSDIILGTSAFHESIANLKFFECIYRGSDLAFNLPIWFLVALFWCNIIFAGIVLFLKKIPLQLLAITIVAAIGCYCGLYIEINPLFILSSCTALPYFCIGYYLKKTNILYSNKHDKWIYILSVILFTMTTFIANSDSSFIFTINYIGNSIKGNILYMYTLSIISVIAFLNLCKAIKYIPFISYVGRYSVIVLGLHYVYLGLIVKILQRFPTSEITNSNMFVYVIVIILCTLSIPILLKYIPSLVAQKDLIKLKE